MKEAPEELCLGGVSCIIRFSSGVCVVPSQGSIISPAHGWARYSEGNNFHASIQRIVRDQITVFTRSKRNNRVEFFPFGGKPKGSCRRIGIDTLLHHCRTGEFVHYGEFLTTKQTLFALYEWDLSTYRSSPLTIVYEDPGVASVRPEDQYFGSPVFVMDSDFEVIQGHYFHGSRAEPLTEACLHNLQSLGFTLPSGALHNTLKTYVSVLARARDE